MLQHFATLNEVRQAYTTANTIAVITLPPLIEVDFYYNRFVVKFNKNGQQSIEHIANPLYASRRMLVADFEALVKNIEQVRPQLPKKWYQSGHIFAINVKEDLLDGLTLIERKVLQEAFLAGGKARRVFVFYQEKAVNPSL